MLTRAQMYSDASTLKIPDANAAEEKESEKLEKIPAWQLTKVRSKKEVIDEARNEGRKIHFASLMDLWCGDFMSITTKVVNTVA